MTRAAPAVPIVSEAAVDALYARSGAQRWGLTRDAFAAGLREAYTKRLGGRGPVEDVIVATMHAEDVGLAIACADGLEPAWDHFVVTFRPALYRAARSMTDEAAGRELADSLYADLFGLTAPGGVRRSLFRYYHGKAKLGTWLRSVLAQRHVDLVRARKRTTSLDDPERAPEGALAAPAAVDPVAAASMRVAALAVTAALATLGWDDRRRLAYYYVHGLKLAAVGEYFGESEATASRKLERARQTLRTAIETALAAQGLRSADVDDWAAVARDAWDAALSDVLAVPAPQAGESSSFQGKRTP